MAEVVVCAGKEEIAKETVKRVKQAAISTTGLFSLALAGGSTPRPFHQALAQEVDFPWHRTILLWGDERCVPPDHADSNYRAAAEDLLGKVHPLAVWRMPGESVNVDDAAINYSAALDCLPGKQVSMTILGMGDDGHTASLFPGFNVPQDRRVVAVPEPGPGKHKRLTFTELCLSETKEVLVLVSGANKASRLAEVLAGGNLPMARVLAARTGKSTYVIADDAAAAEVAR